MEQTLQTQLSFPQIRTVRLNHFSLYRLKPNIEIAVSPGVFCLVGANGLGKSTFLTSLNYALTGIVPSPAVKFMSINEFYALKSFNADYFTGRIAEVDRNSASISVYFEINLHGYRLTRLLFSPKKLSELRIMDLDTGEIILDGDELAIDIEREAQ